MRCVYLAAGAAAPPVAPGARALWSQLGTRQLRGHPNPRPWQGRQQGFQLPWRGGAHQPTLRYNYMKCRMFPDEAGLTWPRSNGNPVASLRPAFK